MPELYFQLQLLTDFAVSFVLVDMQLWWAVLQNSDVRQMYLNAQSEWLNHISVSIDFSIVVLDLICPYEHIAGSSIYTMSTYTAVVVQFAIFHYFPSLCLYCFSVVHYLTLN